MSGKSCAACKKEINDLSTALYCFSCDSIYCGTCKTKLLEPGGKTWACINCKQSHDVDGSMLFKTGH